MCLLHGIEFQIVLQNLYLARLKYLDLCCWVCVFFHQWMPIDVTCGNTFSSEFAMGSNAFGYDWRVS